MSNFKHEVWICQKSVIKAQCFKTVTTRLGDSDFMTRFRTTLGAYGSLNMTIALYSRP